MGDDENARETLKCVAIEISSLGAICPVIWRETAEMPVLADNEQNIPYMCFNVDQIRQGSLYSTPDVATRIRSTLVKIRLFVGVMLKYKSRESSKECGIVYRQGYEIYQLVGETY